MRDAAIQLYKKFPNKFILERARERLGDIIDYSWNDSPDTILNNVAAYIASNIPAYGKKSSAPVPTRIANDEMKMLRFQEEASA